LQRVVGYALDERAAPRRLASDVTIGGGVDRRHARCAGAEDVDTLVGRGSRVRAARVTVEQTDEAVRRQDERRAGAALTLDGHQRLAFSFVPLPPLAQAVALGIAHDSCQPGDEICPSRHQSQRRGHA
jgi:hypothetical protein